MRLSIRSLSCAIAVALLISCRPAPTTPVSRSAFFGDDAALARLIARGASVDGTDRAGLTPLCWAARADRAGAVRMLITHGANPNGEDARQEWTPLLHAVHKHAHGAAAALLQNGADPNRAAGSGRLTPLVMASGYGDTRMVELLLRGGASTRIASANGDSPLDAAVAGSSDIDELTLGRCQRDTVAAILAADAAAPHHPPGAGVCREVRTLLTAR